MFCGNFFHSCPWPVITPHDQSLCCCFKRTGFHLRILLSTPKYYFLVFVCIQHETGDSKGIEELILSQERVMQILNMFLCAGYYCFSFLNVLN